MANVLSTLYPPLVDTFMPAFINTEPAYITFSISPYNEKKQIKYIHVSLVNQQTNINALAANMTAAGLSTSNEYTLRNGILILPIEHNWISYNEETELYTVFIPPSLLRATNENETKKFSTDIFYKAQIRFDQVVTSGDKPSPVTNSDYLIKERLHFSEWSSVCLLKAIPEPTLTLLQFEDENEPPIFNPGIIPVAGGLSFEPTKTEEEEINETEQNTLPTLTGKSEETLRSYSIEIFQKDNPEIILDSTGIVFTADAANPNGIYWLADGESAEPGEYTVRVHYTTKNQYATYKDFDFQIAAYSSFDFFQNPKITFKKVRLLPYEVLPETENKIPKEDLTNIKVFTTEDGIVEFNVFNPDAVPEGYLYIKRSRRENGEFKHWEVLSCTKEANTINRDFVDATVCSLEMYAYSIQFQLKSSLLFSDSFRTDDVNGNNYQLIYPDFYDILLMRDNVQLAIRYDAKINSLTPVVNRQKIDTLGGKYPKFAENAQLGYKQFSISGYIDAESDFNRKFLNDTSEKYRQAMADYNERMNGKYSVRNDTAADETITYKSSSDEYLRSFAQTTLHDLYPQDNWWWQREFRERAMEWLNDGEPKLFRSMPEGNMAVMLTDISLSPNQGNSRRTYSFNATMYEIEDGYSLETLASLGIITIPNEKATSSNSSDDSGDDSQQASVSTIGQAPSIDVKGKSKLGIIFPDSTGEDEGDKEIDYSQFSVLEKIQYIDYDPNSTSGSVYQPIANSLKLHDVKIEFETPPKWFIFKSPEYSENEGNATNRTEIAPIEDASSNLNGMTALGYRLQLIVDNPDADGFGKDPTVKVDVFVDAKGFYQVPSNLTVRNIILFDEAQATINYKMDYNLEFNTSTIPSTIDLDKEIVGQLSGWWSAQTNLSELISKKYKVETYENNKLISYTRFSNWTGLSLDVAPYSVFGIQYKGDSTFESYVVGRTGLFNLTGNYNFEGLRFMGRRMSLAPEHEPIDLDEWEFVLDDSAKTDDDEQNSDLTWNEFVQQAVTESNTLVDISTNENGAIHYTTTSVEEGINRLWNNNSGEQISSLGGYTSISAIKNPKYNTVYGIRDSAGTLSYVIYYIDENWYPVIFNDEYTILAEVPVSGMINYRGKVITTTY